MAGIANLFALIDQLKRNVGRNLQDPMGAVELGLLRADEDFKADPVNTVLGNANIGGGLLGMTKMVKPPKAPQADALETARRNAVEMLGLPENNTPMDRLAAIGNSIDVFHGSPEKNITAFSDGINPVFTSKDKNYASQYADKGQGKKGRVYELKMRFDNMFDSKNPEHLAIYNNEFLPYINNYRSRQNKPILGEIKSGDPVFFTEADQFYRYLKGQEARGRALPFDAVPVKESVDSLYGDLADTSYFPLNSSQLRLKNAAFDPARVNENNLLASRLLPLALPGLLFAGDEEE